MIWRRKAGRLLRRISGAAFGTLIGAAFCLLVAAGIVDDPHALEAAIALSALAAAAAVGLMRRLRFVQPTARAQRASFWVAAATDLADVELGLLLCAAGFGLIAATGGVLSWGYPLVYGLCAFSSTVLARPGAVAILGTLILLEVAQLARSPISLDLAVVSASHVAFLLGAAAAHSLMLRGVASRYRARRLRRLEEELVALRESARDFRLIASALGPTSRAPRARDEEERLLAIGGVEMIDDATGWVLATLRRSLGARSVVLLWLEEDGEHVKLKGISSEAPGAGEPRRLANAGLLGAVIRDRQPLLVSVTKPGQLPYYDDSSAGLALVAVPVIEGGHLRGVLAADRDRAFEEADRDALADAGSQLLRAVQAEQVFRAVERSKYEFERFYQAAAMLGRALTPDQVMETAFDAAQAIIEYDAGVIALYDREHKRHRVAAVRVDPARPLVDAEALRSLEFKDNTGLAAMVVKNRHYLPSSGEPRDLSAPVYTKKIKIDDVKSLLVLPLLAGDEAIGTFTLMARTEKRFGRDVREMLSVIANQVAVALENGLLYKRMETMATTDGLTGLTNHRTFQERFAEMLERAARHQTKVALLLCDVDHFKKVNDNYGHPVGDEVLRRVARVLQEVPRRIDISARYGGEEFTVVLDNVDLAQARQVAERLRSEIEKMVVETEKGPLRVTESIGIALFPDDGRERSVLIERADLGLYHAKHSGRNRVVTYGEYLSHQKSTGARDEAKKAS
jgi:two-component system, cell cycle response regulator